MQIKRKIKILFISVLGVIYSVHSQEQIIKVNAKSPVAPIQSTMYGLFFEDINFGADGGLYAELIKNRSFEFDNHLMGWEAFGNVKIKNEKPCFDKNPNYACLSFDDELTGTGLENSGFKGIGMKDGEKYRFSFFARNKGVNVLKVKVELLGSDNSVRTNKVIEINANDWTKYEVELRANSTDANGKIRIMLMTKGSADFDHISLFPTQTYKNHPNGLRTDLAKALEDMKPGIFRFPGGCIVEGTTQETRYHWKNTIGPVENRPTNINRWNYTFAHRRFTDYYQSYGLGFFEYFQLSEDIGAEPLPVINCGLSCQFENKDDKHHCAVDDLQPYIQDALDLIEFANGNVTSKWGKVRADMGHSAPFNLKFLAVGNEQWGEPYPKRLELFLKAIRKQYPNIQIVGSSGPYPDGKDFEFGWKEMTRLKTDLVDEHYYKSPEWFLKNANRYDKYDRKGPKVFAGEYACHVKSKANNFEAALCEAAFMTGLERNADVVKMTAYAPLFAHIKNWQWRPDLIWFDNLNLVKTPSYFVQQLYCHNVGTHVLKTTSNETALVGQDSLYASSVIDKNKFEIILKIVNVSSTSKKVNYNIEGVKLKSQIANQTVLHQMRVEDENTIERPTVVLPFQKQIQTNGQEITLELQPKSFNVIVLKY